MIKERQLDGIQLAKQRGVYKGRPKKYTENNEGLQHALNLFNDRDKNGMTVKKIEKITNISKATIYRAASQKKMKIEVFDKDMKRVIWTEKYGSIEIARQQIQHMKENHFKVESFDIYLDGELTLF